ncbi:DUF5659 domain-containing protein [Paenibacillus sp. NRS-1781]|uniref:DUF5659 domain-containing protein n=1 Tax=unclassified Paenibacillus TaxID=185978 RepID=UPI003D26B2A2
MVYISNGTTVIHSRKLSLYLQLRGFMLVAIGDDLKSDRNVYLFCSSERLQQAMADYKTDHEFHEYASRMPVRS